MYRFSLTIAVVLSAAAGLAAGPPRRPNVLFLFADDQRADTIGAMGNPAIQTPNLDSLVESGLTIDNAYCLGSNIGAVCTPSRNMLLSGRTYFRWEGRLAPPEPANWPDSMKAAGYETYHHGKKGNTATLIQARFDHNKYLKNDQAERLSGEPGQEIVDEAIGFLKGRDADKPFFMYLAFGNPHDPRVAAEKYLSLYDRDKIPLPPNYLPVHPFDNGEMLTRDEKLAPWPRTEDEVRKHLHEYYATISGLDFHIGRLLATLGDLGLRDDTLILFSADSGLAVGSHGLMGKQNIYEDGMKAPLVFNGPGIHAGRSDAMVYLMDLYPTICEFVGTDVPSGLDGRSFAGVLRGVEREAREDVFLCYGNVQRSIRDDRWKLIRYPHINRTQLFDLANDGYETRDLSGDAGQAERKERMTALLAERQHHFGDTAPLSSDTPSDGSFTPPKE